MSKKHCYLALLFIAAFILAGCGCLEKKPGVDKSFKHTEAHREAAKKAGVPLKIEDEIAEGVSMKMIYIPPGEFMMGSVEGEKSRDEDTESPVHKVSIREGFYIGIYEVTQEQWQSVMNENPSNFKGYNHPVERVSWNDVMAFIAKLNKKAGKDVYRLPSESEWEYAYRAGTATRFYWGNDNEDRKIEAYAWNRNNSGNKTHPVGAKEPNKWGLYDMSGNVYEWCEDDCHGSYKNAPIDGTSWVENPRDDERVLRGGSWFSNPKFCRAASRDAIFPVSRKNSIGFRLVRALKK